MRRLVGQERRNAERHPLSRLVAYYWEGGPPLAHGVRNISLTGMYLLIAVPRHSNRGKCTARPRYFTQSRNLEGLYSNRGQSGWERTPHRAVRQAAGECPFPWHVAKLWCAMQYGQNADPRRRLSHREPQELLLNLSRSAASGLDTYFSRLREQSVLRGTRQKRAMNLRKPSSMFTSSDKAYGADG